MHGIMEMSFTICYKGLVLMKSKNRDKMLCNTAVSITYKWSHSEPGEDHVHTLFELRMSEDTVIRTEGANH